MTKRHKAHVQYKLKDGTIVPGASTVPKELGWNTQALKWWAYKCGRKGIDIKDYTSDTAKVGTLAHKLIEQHLSQKLGTDLDLTEFKKDYTKNQIDQAENSFLSYLEWEKLHEITPLVLEAKLVSEKYRYGGTIDFYGVIDGKLEVMDFKTGSGLYDEYIIQIAGYAGLVEENMKKPERLRLFRIPRTEDETYNEKIIMNWDSAFQIFLDCLDIYNRKKDLK
jgi:hypothetical protein